MWWWRVESSALSYTRDDELEEEYELCQLPFMEGGGQKPDDKIAQKLSIGSVRRTYRLVYMEHRELLPYSFAQK